MAAEGSRSGSAPESYIGSLISLTSKSEMRYEGVLYNINTEESSIGLRNVRSFGTEGRKKDGPQVPPSERVYEYILFRGSDIKDLQVKSSPAAQTSPPVNIDPAIIQSQHQHPALESMTLPNTVVSSTTDTSLQTLHHGSSIQNGVPLNQPGGSVGPWGLSPSSSNGSGIGMSMYWQGYYASPSEQPSIQSQQLLMRPPGLSVPPLVQHQIPPLLQHQMPPSLQQQMPPSLQQRMPFSLQQPMTPQHSEMPSSLQQHVTSSLQPQMPPSLQQQFHSLQQQISPLQQHVTSSLQPQPQMHPSLQQQFRSLQQQISPLQQHVTSSLQPQPQPQMPPSLHQQLPPLQQQMPSSLQSLYYPSLSVPIGSSNLPAAPSLFTSGTSSGILTSTSSSAATFPSSLPSTFPLLPVTSLALDAVCSSISVKSPIAAPLSANKTPVTGLSPASSYLSSGLDGTAALQSLPSKHITTTSPTPQQNVNVPQSVPSGVRAANAVSPQAPGPALLTPGQLLKSLSIYSVPSSQTVHKGVEAVQVSSSQVTEPLAYVEPEVKPPILPSPTPSRPHYKPNGAPIQTYHGYRGRGRGRGRMNSRRPTTTFSEEFDFTAMNEKFKKDEVWGHLGKSSKAHDQEDGKHIDEEFSQYEEFDLPKIDIKPVYNKDDFFDSLSSNAQDQESNHGRHRYSEQKKIDTETFGELSRYHGGRGSRSSGGHYRGSLFGRGYYGRGGYGYGRGRGRGGPNRVS
ncbi:hypothetical protein QQ045_032956 [Rhodiola kirilowii]